MAANQERDFKHFNKVPPELREMVVDDMHPEDRCRYSGSSKLSNREAKNSKNYMYGLLIRVESREEVRITVEFGDPEKYPNTIFKLELEEEENGNKVMKCSSRGGEMCRTDLDRSIDLNHYGVQHFLNLLNRYQNTIRRLVIYDEFPDDIDFEVTSLKQLEELKVGNNLRAAGLLIHTRRPLRKLRLSPGDIREHEMEKVLQVQHTLEVSDLELNYEQFLQLSALNIEIHVGQLTPQNIYEFIEMWKRGNLGRDFELIDLDLTGTQFDTAQLFRLLGSRDFNGDTSNIIDIRHDREAEKLFWVASGADHIRICLYDAEEMRNIENIVEEEHDNVGAWFDEPMDDDVYQNIV